MNVPTGRNTSVCHGYMDNCMCAQMCEYTKDQPVDIVVQTCAVLKGDMCQYAHEYIWIVCVCAWVQTLICICVKFRSGQIQMFR